MPSYMTLRRFFLSQGLHKRPRRGPVHSPGAQVAEVRFATREVRSYQSDHVNALWHLDFHHGSRRVLLPGGQWVYPILLGILDDCSRLCGHAQWYLSETAEELTHGLIQAFEKRELPRALMSDNGSAMLAGEIEQGLQRLGIVHERTLPYSPYQNGKQEAWWNQIEGRLLPMLEGVVDLSMAALNEATLAWVELEYNRKPHSELGKSPLEMYRHARDVGRPSPSTQALQEAFTLRTVRTQRRSDGTLSLAGRRFEIPSRYAHFQRVSLRYASWDLARVYLADPHSGDLLERIYPLDKSQNAGGLRALRASPSPRPGVAATPCGMAPLLQKILQQYAATGLPPAYLPKEEITPTSPTGPLSP
jgi:transposase InsO family protein